MKEGEHAARARSGGRVHRWKIDALKREEGRVVGRKTALPPSKLGVGEGIAFKKAEMGGKKPFGEKKPFF